MAAPDAVAVPDAVALDAVTAALLAGTTVELTPAGLAETEVTASGNGTAAPDPDQTPAAD